MGIGVNLTSLQIDSVIVKFEDLLQMRPVEEIFEHRTAGQGPGFKATVTIMSVGHGLEICG